MRDFNSYKNEKYIDLLDKNNADKIRTLSLLGLCCRTKNTDDIALIVKPGSPINALWHISYKNFNTTVAQKNITKTYKNTNKIFRLLYV